jgi:hypothetical protein
VWTVAFRRDQAHEMRALFEQRRPLWWSCQALFAAALAWLLRKKPLHEALCLSFPLLWACASPAYYYYAFLVVPLLYCAEKERPARALGLACVFATSLFARAFHGGATFGEHFAFKLSIVMGALALVMLAYAALERAPQRAPLAPR